MMWPVPYIFQSYNDREYIGYWPQHILNRIHTPRNVKAKSSVALCEEENFDFQASRRHLTIKNLIKSSKLRRKKFYRNPN